MSLFEINLEESAQYVAKEALRSIVSQCPVWQHLCERYSPEEAAEKVVSSPHDGPWKPGNYTQEELDNLFCEAQIWAPDQLTETTQWTGMLGDGHYRNGVLVLRVRRTIREPERAEGEQQLYDYLVAAADLLACQLIDIANTSEEFRRTITSIEHTSPAYATLESQVAQGDYAHWLYMIHWGDIEEDN